MKFTIITVTRNNIVGLKKTRLSVISQAFSEYQWIVIDGGSNDGSCEFLASLEDPFLTWVSEKDGGIFDAMNKGIRQATGDYCIFLNAGDELCSSNILTKTAYLIGSRRPNMVFGDAIERGENGMWFKRARRPALNFYSMFAHHQSIFYRIDDIQRGYDLSYKFCADWALTTKILKSGVCETIRAEFAICIFERGGVSQRDDYRKVINGEHWRICRAEQGLALPAAWLIWSVKVAANGIRASLPGLYDRIRFKPAS